jgi:carboxypeptidase C (cathepsin A)
MAIRKHRRVQWTAVWAALVAVMLLMPAAHAEDDAHHPGVGDQTAARKDAAPAHKDADAEKPKVTRHAFDGQFNGEHVAYDAVAAEMFIKNDDGKNTASMFSVSYIKHATDPARRPVTFVFNGGPGSASLWLHLGVFGPKTIALPRDGAPPAAAPYDIEDNKQSILDVTDLVFIDPVGTGYSHAMGDSKDEDFWGMEADAKSIGTFIRRWLTENQRWNSPKYLAGESYGTTRAAQLASTLQTGGDGIYLNGVVLISSVLDFHTSFFNAGNDLPYITYLPTYAAAAWYHDKIEPKPADLDAFLREVRSFAQNEYASALMQGSALSGDARADIVKRLSHYTGLSEDYISQANLRVAPGRFRKQLLRDRGLVLGRYDARIVGKDFDNAGEKPDADPAFYTIDGAFTAAINDYLTRVLKVNIDSRYRVLDSDPSNHWKWQDHPGPGSYVNVADGLGEAMRQNADLRVFAANGLYDLATPFFATEVTLAHNAIPADRVSLSYFAAGHMMYTHGPSRDGLARAVRAFIRAGSGSPRRDAHTADPKGRSAP